MKIALIEKSKVSFLIALTAIVLASPGCLVRKVTHPHASETPVPARLATLGELVGKVDAQSKAVKTLSAIVDLEPTAGSVYSGVIKEYHDVKGAIVLERPANIRIQGQAPVVGTRIFDMVSNGDEFKLYIPSKQKFIVGKTSYRHTTSNALENLRPQHILQALLVTAIDPAHESPVLEQAERRSQRRRFYVVDVIQPQGAGHFILRRKIWFDRADLEMVQTQYYDPDGTCTEDVSYSLYQDFQGVHYPSKIEITRPVEDYQLTITIEKATFNEPIAAEKFDLKKPEGAQLVNLDEVKPEEKPVGK